MNYKMVLKTVGRLLWAEAALLCLPLLVSLYYKENLFHIYLIVIGLLLCVGGIMNLPKPEKRTLYAREGFVIVSLSWILMSLFGALPFFLSREIPSFVDAVFEVVSGFTTTGATILTDIEAVSKSLLFWRAFTHWLGGMGVIVFVLAFLPQKDMQSMHILRAEVPGPSVGKLVSKATATARILYVMYAALTVAQIIALICCRMPLFDSVTTAFATAGTGIKSVIDHYYILKNLVPKCNNEILNDYLTQSGLKDFNESFTNLTKYWFMDAKADETIKKMSDYIILSGAYGTDINFFVNSVLRISDDKKSYFLERLFPNLETLSYRYPILKKYKFLLPLFWVIRIFSSVFDFNRIKNEATGVANVEADKKEKQEIFLKNVGL